MVGNKISTNVVPDDELIENMSVGLVWDVGFTYKNI